MNRPAETPSLLADAIEIPQWLECDRATPFAERAHRDRMIAAKLPAGDALARVRGWWREIRRQGMRAPAVKNGERFAADDADRVSGAEPGGNAESLAANNAERLAARLETGRRLISLLMVVLGIIGGVAAASAVFNYDGTWPVNVVTVLAALVLLQLVLIVLTLVLMLPRVPGLRCLQDVIASINPGAIGTALYRRAGGESAGPLAGWHAARGPAASRFARWQMLAWSQLAAVAFNVAVLTTAGALITFTDLAFGWSTTLQLSSGEAFQITSALSRPWQGLWPEAVPPAALVEGSRFFRLATAEPGIASASALTGWWPFLLAAIVTYALLPRCVLLIVALLRLRASTVRLLLDDPRVRALIDRMESAEIALGGASSVSLQANDAAPDAVAAPARGAAATAIVWSGALPAASASGYAARHLQRSIGAVFEAGGGRALSADKAIIDEVAGRAPSTVLVFVSAWEAPLLDLRDFLAALRERLGARCSLVLVPVGENGEAPTRTQRNTWSHWTARIADPALYMETGA